MNAAAGFVRVTNTSDRTIEGGYDGRQYVFAPGKPEDVPEIVATHIFGFKTKDKSAAFARLGLLNTSDQHQIASDFLSKIRIEPVQFAPKGLDDDDLGSSTQDMSPEQQIDGVSPQSPAGGAEGAGLLSPAPGAPLGRSDDLEAAMSGSPTGDAV